MYPIGHPTIGPGIEAVCRRASELLRDRSSVAFGVARRQLIIDGVATNPDQPLLRRLAECLHAHHFGAMSLQSGVQADEIGEALLALASDPQRDGPLGLTRDGRVHAWPHVKLHPLTFDGLALVGDAELSTDESGGKGDTGGAELWLGLARVAASVDAGEGGRGPVPSEPSEVARAIDDHPSADAYDQAIVGYLLQIARDSKAGSGSEALRKKTSSLIGSLRSDTLQRLVKMGGDVSQRGEFVLDATHGMAVKAVVQIVQAAGEASGQTISNGLLRMLTKLAAHAENGPEHVRPQADAELREQVTRLMADWQLADPNPESYGRVLQHFAGSGQGEEPGACGGHEAYAGMAPLRVIQMSLECGVLGPVVTSSLTSLVEAGQVRAVHDLLKGHPPGAADVVKAILSVLAQPATLRILAAQEPVDFDMLGLLVPHLTQPGYEVVLEALATSEVRVTRWKLLGLLTRARLDLGGAIAARLEDERWYVQRNMLVLLQRREQVPAGLSLTPWTGHPDGRVRVEAIRVQLRMPNERDPAVLKALEDVDPRIATLGLKAVQTRQCPSAAVHRIVEIALKPEGGDEVRCLAATALGRVRESEALVALLNLSDGGRSFLGLGPRKLPPRTPVLVASLRALAQQWAGDPRAVETLRLALRSPDVELREAVQQATS